MSCHGLPCHAMPVFQSSVIEASQCILHAIWFGQPDWPSNQVFWYISHTYTQTHAYVYINLCPLAHSWLTHDNNKNGWLSKSENWIGDRWAFRRAAPTWFDLFDSQNENKGIDGGMQQQRKMIMWQKSWKVESIEMNEWMCKCVFEWSRCFSSWIVIEANWIYSGLMSERCVTVSSTTTTTTTDGSCRRRDAQWLCVFVCDLRFLLARVPFYFFFFFVFCHMKTNRKPNLNWFKLNCSRDLFADFRWSARHTHKHKHVHVHTIFVHHRQEHNRRLNLLRLVITSIVYAAHKHLQTIASDEFFSSTHCRYCRARSEAWESGKIQR